MDLTSLSDSKSGKASGNTNSPHYVDAQLALAFQTDCENLLHKFKDRGNYSFTTFAQVWKESCFIAIFKFTNNILLLQSFVENCFLIVKKFLVSGDLHLQTGAIYILYGLYYKQPIKRWVKIRLTQFDVTQLDEIIHTHKSMYILDPIFIYNKMRLDGAFEYCSLPRPLGLELHSMKRYDLTTEGINVKRTQDSVLGKFKNLMEQDPDLVQLEETDEEYRKLAQKYKKDVFVFPSKIGEDLKKVYCETFQVDLEEPEGDSEHVKATKSRAMSNTNAIYRGDKKVFTALDLDLDAPSTSKEH